MFNWIKRLFWKQKEEKAEGLQRIVITPGPAVRYEGKQRVTLPSPHAKYLSYNDEEDRRRRQRDAEDASNSLLTNVLVSSMLENAGSSSYTPDPSPATFDGFSGGESGGGGASGGWDSSPSCDSSSSFDSGSSSFDSCSSYSDFSGGGSSDFGS